MKYRDFFWSIYINYVTNSVNNRFTYVMLALFLKIHLIIFVSSLNLCWLSIVNAIDELVKCIVIFAKYAREALFRCLTKTIELSKHTNYIIIYVFDQAFYVWILLYINKSIDEWSSFTVASIIDFMKNSRSRNFQTRELKKFWDIFSRFCDFDLKLFVIKIASSLIKSYLNKKINWNILK
jgi:hypothetical protein